MENGEWGMGNHPTPSSQRRLGPILIFDKTQLDSGFRRNDKAATTPSFRRKPESSSWLST